MHVANAVMPRPEQAQLFFAGADSGPMVMINLLKFKDKAEYPDGSDAGLSGKDAYLRYGAAVQKCLEMVGGRAVFSGDVTGIILGDVEELWDMVALAWYPGPQAMLQMVGLPEYQGIEVHRFAGLAGQLNIRTAPGLMAL
ncbi:DUF1330 domain-containing protein [Sandarakinorhabdus sp. DWP1-3-1]|uniref:DUF1330 domain-containing protein n=1 Tax=Sandarakinorhabdus sp. DWP1-3-1 TaxID=2804627 RepID=UPI003CF1C0B6